MLDTSLEKSKCMWTCPETHWNWHITNNHSPGLAVGPTSTRLLPTTPVPPSVIRRNAMLIRSCASVQRPWPKGFWWFPIHPFEGILCTAHVAHDVHDVPQDLEVGTWDQGM